MKKLTALAAVLLLLVFLASSCAAREEETGAGAQEDTEAVDREDAAFAKTSDAPLPKAASFDPKDERQVVGGSDDVFFGRVLERTGSEKAPPIGSRGFREPQAQYAVQVTQSIKGRLSDVVTVNRMGGPPEAPGVGPLLKEGREYLFATKYVDAKGWHQIVLPTAGVIEVEDGAHRKELQRRYEEAYDNEIWVNLPLPFATPEEVEERTYRPCWPDKSGPPGCDPSDPPPTTTDPREKAKGEEMDTSNASQDTK